MFVRNLSFVVGGLALFVTLAFTTEYGALAFLAPGFGIEAVLFPVTPGTYVSQGATPAEAMMELAILKASDRYVHSLWCAVAFWLTAAILLLAVLHRTNRCAPNTSGADA